MPHLPSLDEAECSTGIYATLQESTEGKAGAGLPSSSGQTAIFLHSMNLKSSQKFWSQTAPVEMSRVCCAPPILLACANLTAP